MWETIVSDYGVFVLKLVTILVVIGVIVALAKQSKEHKEDGEIELTDLSEKYADQKIQFDLELLDEKSAKDAEKKRKKEEKKADDTTDKSRLFVIEFEGDVHASAVETLREEITAILMSAKSGDEVLVKLYSPGGVVDAYGLAAAQLGRLKQKNIPLTVAVDQVAASGGYMMACVADKIVAAPFSVIGSIGVVAEVPNIHRLLKKNDIDVDIMTSGQYKRTVTFLGENTPEGKEKFQEELHQVHDLFKRFVLKHRPQLAIEVVATGETWYGEQALEKQLIDAIGTSDDVILDALEDKQVVKVTYVVKNSLLERIGLQSETSIERLISKLWHKRTPMK